MPYIWHHFLAGMVAIHMWGLYFYCTGWLVRGSRRPLNDALALADVVISTAGGMAIFAFAIFSIGIAGLLNNVGMGIVAILEIAAFAAIARRKALTARALIGELAAPICRGFTPAAILLYLALIIVAIPAALPPGNFDVMQFYLPTPLAWANAGRIFSDVTLPWPYYVNNFLLLYAAFFRLGLGNFTNFLPWLCGALSTLGIFATVRAFALAGTRHAAPIVSVGIPIALSTAFFGMPTFLRWVNGGMLDVPIGTFVFVPVMCAALSLLGNRGAYRWELVVTAAFAAGLKPTLPAFLPLFIVLWFVAAPVRVSRRAVVTGLMVLVALSSPWYLRNLLLDGDPAPPLLHVALHQPDPIFTAADIHNQFSGLQTSRSPGALAILPVRFFFDTLSADFIDYGTNATVLLIYAPFIALGMVVLQRRSCFGSASVLMSASFVFCGAYWVLTTHHARFFLEIDAVFIAALGALIVDLLRNTGAAQQLAAFVLAIAGIVPSPSSWGFLTYLYQVQYLNIAGYIPTLQQFNETFCDGCPEADYVAHRIRSGERVYLLDLLQVTYLLRERGIPTVGSRFSAFPGGGLVAATEKNDLARYLKGLSVGALLVDSHADWPDASERAFSSQIAAAGFHEVRLYRPRNDGHIIIYVRSTPAR